MKNDYVVRCVKLSDWNFEVSFHLVEVVEWSVALFLKTSDEQASVDNKVPPSPLTLESIKL